MRWKHLNIFNQACELVCDLPRGKCRQCGGVYRVTPPWEGKNKHFTKDFETFALTLMREMPVKKVGQIVQVDEGRLWRMLLNCPFRLICIPFATRLSHLCTGAAILIFGSLCDF